MDYSEFHCALVRRAVFDRIGPLDERILGAAEHIDLALHLRALGARGFFEPTAIVSYLPPTTHWATATTIHGVGAEPVLPTMAHLVEKSDISPEAPLLHDYLESFTHFAGALLGEKGNRRSLSCSPQDLGQAQTIVQLLDQLAACGYRDNEVVQNFAKHTVSHASSSPAASEPQAGRSWLI